MAKAKVTYAVAYYSTGLPYLMQFPSKKAFKEFKANGLHWGVYEISASKYEHNKASYETVVYKG